MAVAWACFNASSQTASPAVPQEARDCAGHNAVRAGAAGVLVPLISITILQRLPVCALAIAYPSGQWAFQSPGDKDSRSVTDCSPTGTSLKPRQKGLYQKRKRVYGQRSAGDTVFWILSIAFALRLMVTVALTTISSPTLLIRLQPGNCRRRLARLPPSVVSADGFRLDGDRLSKKY